MRKHLEKFPLEMSDGVKVNTMKELRENFSLDKIIGYFENKKLEQWLRDRFYDDEADALKNLYGKKKNLAEKICEIFGVDYETISWRRERLNKLQAFTKDEKNFGAG